MTYDEMMAVAAILSAVLVLSGIAIARNYKPPTMADVDPGQTPVEQRRKAWADAQAELEARYPRRIK